MTANKLQALVRVLANSCWCRYWLNYYNSCDDVKMAIQCRDYDGKPLLVKDLANSGFEELADHIYTIKRTAEDGQAYLSKLSTTSRLKP